MTRPLFRPRWNEAENCPGPTPIFERVLFITCWPLGVLKYRLRGHWWSIAATIWYARHWFDWGKP